MKESTVEAVVLVTRDQLPMHCPAPNSTLWDGHPKVYIPLEGGGVQSCSYCGTRYHLVDAKSGSQPDNGAQD